MGVGRNEGESLDLHFSPLVGVGSWVGLKGVDSVLGGRKDLSFVTDKNKPSSPWQVSLLNHARPYSLGVYLIFLFDSLKPFY